MSIARQCVNSPAVCDHVIQNLSDFEALSHALDILKTFEADKCSQTDVAMPSLPEDQDFDGRVPPHAVVLFQCTV